MLARRQFVFGLIVFVALGVGLVSIAGAFGTTGLLAVAGVEALVVLGIVRAAGRA